MRISLRSLYSLLIFTLIALSTLTLFWQSWADYFSLNILIELRLPRLLTALSVGGILACCGAIMQAQFRNPLADSGLIGISSGASLGAACALALHVSNLFVHIGAFLGALLTSVFVQIWAKHHNNEQLLIVGVALNALCSAALAILMILLQDQSLKTLLFWLLGSFAHTEFSSALLLCLGLIAFFFFILPQARALDCLLLGEKNAYYAGIDVKSYRTRQLFALSILLGITVSLTGIIGFIGLIVPHALRQLGVGSFRNLLPLSILCGALLSTGADFIAQTLFPPFDLPIGAMMSVMGAPCLLWMLNHHSKVNS